MLYLNGNIVGTNASIDYSSSNRNFIKTGKPSKQRLFLVLYDLNKSPEAAMKKILLLVSLLTASFALHAQPELKGSPEELRHFLHPSERIVSLHGQAEEKAYSDRAIISLVITTEDKLLSNSIASNSNLRKFITTQLTTAGINGESIKSSKFSTSPQYGWFGKKPRQLQSGESHGSDHYR